MLTLLTLSAILSAHYAAVVTHSDIGIVEVKDAHENQVEQQQGLLRRRLVPGGLSNQDKLAILNLHNKYRNMTARGQTNGQPSASNMNELIWDDGLAQVAQAYSSKCNWAHNSNRNKDLLNYLGSTSFDYTNQAVGENLFITTGSENLDVLLQGIQYWYAEYMDYNFGTVSGSASCTSGQQCGHYTQLVWASTRYVGCGYTKCASTNGISFSNAVLFACNYYFAGNIVGYSPYKTGSSASSCASDRTPDNGLCGGCPSSSWDKYCCEYCSASSCATSKVANLVTSPSSCDNGLGVSIISANQSPAISVPSPTTPSPTTPSPTTASPTTASPTTQSPTTPSPTTPSPTTATKSASNNRRSSESNGSNGSNSNSCCKASNSRYATFCSSITSADMCNVYSAVCFTDGSC